MDLKKGLDPGPVIPVGTKREHPDTNNSTTNSPLVYVRRKIDHEQQNKPSSSNEILKNGGGEKEKAPSNESEPDLDLECHETNLDSDMCELKVIAPNGVANKETDSNLGPNEKKNDLKLVGTTSSGQNENKSDSKLDSESSHIPKIGTNLSPIENQNEQLDSQSPNQVTNKDINDPKLGSNSSELMEEITPNQGINSDKNKNVSNLGQDDIANEVKFDTENKTEPKLDSQFTESHSNQEKNDSNLGPNGKIHEPGLENQVPRNMDWRERYIKLQIFLKDCERSSQEDYIRMLRSLSAMGRSKHALDLEKRAMNLLMEEGKELRRMNYLNVLGNASVSAPVHTQK